MFITNGLKITERRALSGGGKIADLICGNEVSCNDYVLCCESTPYEYLYNFTFECGLLGWGFDEKYPATLTQPIDGEVHLVTNSNYGSVVPLDVPDTNNGEEWVARCKVKNLSGAGKMSIRLGTTWINTDFTGDGIYEKFFTGNLTEFHCGAAGDPNANMDFDWVSLRKASDPAPAAFLVDENSAFLVDDSNAYITEG